jgi:hypothetical protein
LGTKVDGPVETRIEFDYPVEELKNRTRVPLSETTSKRPSCSKPEETFNNSIPKDFSSNHTFIIIMICHLIGSNNR